MKLNELNLKTYYVIIHKDTQELLFDERVFTGTGPAKNAFRHHFGRRKSSYFDNQEDYVLVPIELTYTPLDTVKDTNWKTQEELDELVNYWHEKPKDLTLYEFLGLTWEQYKYFPCSEGNNTSKVGYLEWVNNKLKENK